MRPSLRQAIRRDETWWLVWAGLTTTTLVLEAILGWHLTIPYLASIGGFSLVQWLLGQETLDSELTRTQSEISAVFQLGLGEMRLLADRSKRPHGEDWG